MLFFFNRGLINNCSHLISFCIKNFGNEKNIKIINKDKENPSFKIKFKNADAFFLTLGLRIVDKINFLLFNSDRYIESKEKFQFFCIYPATSSDLIKNTFDYNEKKSQIILNNDNKAQLHVLDYLYKIRNSDKKFNYYNKLNYNTYKLLDKIRRIK